VRCSITGLVHGPCVAYYNTCRPARQLPLIEEIHAGETEHERVCKRETYKKPNIYNGRRVGTNGRERLALTNGKQTKIRRKYKTLRRRRKSTYVAAAGVQSVLSLSCTIITRELIPVRRASGGSVEGGLAYGGGLWRTIDIPCDPRRCG